MAGPGGREVGRLSIRVLPDTSRFATSLQAYLDRVESRARVRVKALADTRGFATQLRSELAGEDIGIDVRVTPDASRFYDQLRGQLVSVRFRELPLPVVPDTRNFARRLRQATAGLDRATSIRVRVQPDFAGFRERLRTQMERNGGNPGIPVRLEVRAAEILRIRQQLAHIQPPITIPVRFTEERGTIGRLRERIESLGSSSGAAGGVAGNARLIGLLAAAAVTAIPNVASLSVALAQMAPAAALGASGVLALVSTVAALKIGTQGVGDALKSAFDPKASKKFNEAMAKLTPNAKSFVLALKAAQPQFSAFRKAVQEKLFANLGKQITATGKVALPVLQKGLVGTAGALNQMGLGVLSSARQLSSSGQLGKALTGTNKGLSNLSKIPGQFVTGLTQIAVAASPAFDRLTKAAAGSATKLGDRIAKSLKSGRLTEIIDQAVTQVGRLFDVIGNLGTIIKNVFGPAAQAGGDFLGVLKNVTGELAKVTATDGVQDALKAVFTTLATVGQTAAKLLGEALKAVAPAVLTLAGPVQTLVKALGAGLTPVIRAAAPLLASLAATAGRLVTAFAPLAEVAGRLLAGVFEAAAPLVQKVGEQLALLAESAMRILGPALKALPGLLNPVMKLFGALATVFLEIQNKVLKALQPAFEKIGEAFGKILVALKPLVDAIVEFVTVGLAAILPVLDPIIAGIGELASLFASGLARAVTEVVVPAIQAITALLKGDFSTAWDLAKQAALNGVELIRDAFDRLPALLGAIMLRVVDGFERASAEAVATLNRRFGEARDKAVLQISQLPRRASAAVAPLVGNLQARVNEAGRRMVVAIQSQGIQFIATVQSLPGRARAALGSLGNYLYGAGVQLIAGLINGVMSQVNSLVSAARGAVDAAVAAAKSALGIHSPSRVFAQIGRFLMLGFIQGIDATTAKLKSRIESISKLLPAVAGSRLGKALASSNRQLSKLVARRDAVIKSLSAAEKRLTDLSKQRAASAEKIRQGILDDADITRGGNLTSASAIAEKLQNDLLVARKFAEDIAQLRKRGLRADLLNQLAQAGVAGGAAAAAALAKASKSEIKGINQLQAELAAAAARTGAIVSDAMYKNGIDAARGIVAGLKSQKSAIERMLIDIAKGMQKAIKRALGIRSPARAMIPVGENTVLGVVEGISREQSTLASAMQALVQVPTIPRLSSSVSLAAPNMDGRQLKLVVGGREFDAYVQDQADGRVAVYDQTQSMRATAGRRT